MNRLSKTWRRGPAAVATAVTGLVTIGAQLSEIALSGRHVRSSLPLLPLHILGIAGGLGLLMLAVGLWHGKGRAAQVAIAALALIGSAKLAFGLSPAFAAIDLAAAGFILLNLNAFRRGSESGAATWLTGPAGLVAGASLYALYAVVATGATRGTEVDHVITAANGVLPDGPVLAGTVSHPGLLINASIALREPLEIAGTGHRLSRLCPMRKSRAKPCVAVRSPNGCHRFGWRGRGRLTRTSIGPLDRNSAG